MMEYQATYCPEDNKIRLYTGRVERSLYDCLHAQGWTSTPKQECDFVAHWSADREDMALALCEYIGDEDQSPADRAADRAERFSGYRDNRISDAEAGANRFEALPIAHGYQNEQKAERAAARHTAIGRNACNEWSKAEYWTRRTAGVIQNAMYKLKPSVRMGRIKILEADQRKIEKNIEQHNLKVLRWEGVHAIAHQETKDKILDFLCGECWGDFDGKKLYQWQEAGETLEQLQARYLGRYKKIETTRGLDHVKLRLEYERAMLEAAGGMAGEIEMQVGGFIGKFQIHKVNKSAVSGRVVSVSVLIDAPEGWSYKTTRIPGTNKAYSQIDVEKMDPSFYRAPEAGDVEKVEQFNKDRKSAAPKAIPVINPDMESAQRLQAAINAQNKARFPNHATSSEVREMTQAEYSAISTGSYARAETMIINKSGGIYRRGDGDSVLCKVRTRHGLEIYSAERVIILTDKPQKPLPAFVQAADLVTV